MDRLDDFRSVFARVVTARGECRDPAVRAAFAHVPRHEFMGPGPWLFTEHGEPADSLDPALLYQDIALALAPTRGITTGLPSLHARCMGACAVRPGERVLHVGAGSGYYTAILAELVGPSGHVHGIEIDTELAALAIRNLRPWPWARVEARSGLERVEPADVVYVSAAVEQIPADWLAALRPGGRLLLPLVPHGADGAMLLARRTGSAPALAAELFSFPARFVPCAGTADPELHERLVTAFRSRPLDSLRSLRTAPETPDASTWVAGRDWWLSTRAAD